MSTLFERQLATYSSYHRDHRNRLTHFIGIPAIVFSLIILLALWQVQFSSIRISGAWLVWAAACLGWIALDLTIGLAMALVLLPVVVFADWFAATYGSAATLWLFGILFVGGWVFQLVGHAFEGRRPALADNLFQAFIGPMFIMAEVLMMLGLRRDLARFTEQ
ncbi:DUF962 domain-containing protein [Microvirga terricola]|uniref:DUF962 domain-containing protein n=1 Tax=Microvirga terricola TaxID=2719797 RepID=A0ABX0V5Y1_9HYPH|nr:Mpo1-like protein [Microvirga terricola]NIX75127.1 DUF962 domain-containing protein [Microvirga terricola]